MVRKFFYSEHPEITALTEKQVLDLRGKLGVRASGLCPPKPLVSFAHAGFDEEIMNTIQKLGCATRLLF
jgi:ATP-dependent RNA helicase DDX42